MNDQISKPTLAMILPSCKGRAIGDNAIRRGVAISDSFQVVIISDSFPDFVPKEIQTIRIKPRRFNYLRRFCHVPNEIAFARASRAPLLKLANTGNLVFVFCHGYTVTYFAGMWLREKADIPFGMFMHGHIFENRPKRMYDSRVTWLYKTLAPQCYRQADLLFALSPAQAELAVKAGANSERVLITPNGLDYEDIGLTKKQAEDKVDNFILHKPLRCIYVGRLSIEKGVDVLLRACAELHARGVIFCLDIIGGGPEEQNLRGLCTELELDEKIVRFLGPAQRRELGKHYLEHDIQFVPSLTEALGNVVLEGMASACLVIASDTGGIPSMIKPGVSGVLVETGNSAAIAEAVVQVLTDSQNVKDMIEYSFMWQLQYASWENIGVRITESVIKT